MSCKSKCGCKVTEKSYYELKVPVGKYTSDSLMGLVWEVFTHRLWHLFKHRRWTD